MKQFYGTSASGDLREASNGLACPKLIMLMSNEAQFIKHVQELERMYPGVPSIGCVAMTYGKKVTEKGVGLVAFTEDVTVVTNVLEEASVMPVKYIRRLEQDMRKVNAASKDTVCIDFCTGNDACMVTTIYSALGKKDIQLVGGTSGCKLVSVNGRVYEDAAVYALVKNAGRKVKVYKENLYRPLDEHRLIASKTQRSEYILNELNAKPAKQVYQNILKIKESDILSQTFKNPIGKLVGKDMCIISIKEVIGNALVCYRQVNESDVLTLLELGDPKQIVEETIANIRKDFQHISAVFSINCILRYLWFSDNHYIQNYLDTMGTLGNHVGFIGNGEHFNSQFVNQTMTCVVFE
jgi:hypothetical protein